MDFAPLVEQKRRRFQELEPEIAAQSLFENPKRAREAMREHSQIKRLLDDWVALKKAEKELEENRELSASRDPDLAELAASEIPILEKRAEELGKTVQFALLPPEPHEDRDAIVEIRAGTGGNEAALFAADLYRMYCKYAESHGFRLEQLESSPSELGGFKEIIFKVGGTSVFRMLRYESGVHRVQRVPVTEAQGRIHTSTATVAVLPEAEEVDVKIEDKDLRIDVFRSQGPGGQSVNTTDSAVRITHLPTNLVVQCQDQKSQLQNKIKAMEGLRSRLLDRIVAEQESERARDGRAMVGTGDRSAKIRTYNFPQNRVTDHRIGFSVHNLSDVLDGKLDDLLSALRQAGEQERMSA